MDGEYYYSNKTNMRGDNNMNCFETLKQRGYVYQLTHEKEIIQLLNGEPITFYLGIDPTADSLHIGHFFALTMARWLQDFGHNAIILVGGATALIGDPSGRSDMRGMLTKEQVEHNKKEVKELVKKFMQEDTLIVDNADWFKGRDYVDFMREVGAHFNVNKMLATEGYKRRLEEGGLTFLEMGYMLMQAFDFVLLKEKENCVLQIGGSDQWGNIVAGVELGRKMEFHDNHEIGNLYGLVCPLLFKADGEKMGKTAKGTLWVSRDRTASYDFYQSFVNSFDEDVERLLSFFTRINMEEIKRICEEDIISAKKLMAFEVTKLVHGEAEALKVAETAEKVFSGEVTDTMPTVEITGETDILSILVNSELAPSKSEARRLIEQGGISIDNEKVTDVSLEVSEKEFIIQKGKKVFLKIIIK